MDFIWLTLTSVLQDEDSPPANETKDKLDALKEREIKREPDEQVPSESMSAIAREGSGKGAGMLDVKKEIKSEPMETGEDSAIVKEEPMSPSGQTAGEDAKPSFKIEPIAPSNTDKKPKCCKYTLNVILNSIFDERRKQLMLLVNSTRP